MPEAEDPPPLLSLRGSTFRAYKLTPLHATSASSSSRHHNNRTQQPSSSTAAARKKKEATVELPLSTPSQLKHHAARFANFLVGHTVEKSLWEEVYVSETKVRGVSVYVKTSRGAYTAFLLRRSSHNSNDGGMSIHYPLLLTRMTADVGKVMAEYIGTHFDAHVSALRVPLGVDVNAFMEVCLGGYVGSSEVVGRDLQLVFEPPGLKPDTTSPSERDNEEDLDMEGGGGGGGGKEEKMKTLSSLSLTVGKDDVLQFHTRGRTLLSSQTSNGDGGDWKQPFTASFAHHVFETTGVRLGLMTLGRVSCGNFVLGVVTPDRSIRCKFFDGGVGDVERGDGDGEGEEGEENREAWTGLLDKLLDVAYA